MESLPSDTPAEKRLWELMCVVYETHSARHELTIRALTLEFDLIREAVERVDRKRIGFVRGLLAGIGLDGDELEMRTLVFVATTSLDRQLLSGMSDETYRNLLKQKHAFFVRSE